MYIYIYIYSIRTIIRRYNTHISVYIYIYIYTHTLSSAYSAMIHCIITAAHRNHALHIMRNRGGRTFITYHHDIRCPVFRGLQSTVGVAIIGNK